MSLPTYQRQTLERKRVGEMGTENTYKIVLVFDSQRFTQLLTSIFSARPWENQEARRPQNPGDWGSGQAGEPRRLGLWLGGTATAG